MSETFRELSKQNFTPIENSIDAINTGSLQRIADATEVMARNYYQLQKDLDFYKKKYLEKIQEIENLEKRISSLRGVITKLKNKKL